MANELLIKKRMAVVEEKMATIIRQIKKDYQQGKIKDAVSLQHRISIDLQNFYDSIGESTLEVIEAWGPPYSKDHNGMMLQIYNDISTIYDEITNLTTDLQNSFEQVELERMSFEKRILEAENVVKGIDLSIGEAISKIIFRDHFVDLETFDQGAVELQKAYLSTNEGLLTLNRVQNEEFNDYATITITQGNGLPGNTHVVRSTGSNLKFDGEDGLHINLADILDNNKDTWFEYEGFEIHPKVREEIEGRGLGFKEPIDWVTSYPNGLSVTIEIEISKPKSTNWLSLIPFLSQDRGAMPAVFEKVSVSDGKGTIYNLAIDERFDAAKGFLFPQIKCKTVTITLQQKVGYEVNVGHLFFKQLNTEEINVMDPNRIQEGVLVNGQYPSITNLGVTYDTGTKEIVYPVTNYGDTIIDEEEKKNALFLPPTISSNVHSGIERINARRYMVGLRDALVASYQFAIESEYRSYPFESERPISQIELDVDMELPKQFPTDEEWLEYYISVDEGQNWNRIYPRDIYQSGLKTKYMINSDTPSEARLEEVGYIDSLTPVHSVNLRIIMRRPEGITDASYYTPILYGYEIHVLVEGEVGV